LSASDGNLRQFGDCVKGGGCGLKKHQREPQSWLIAPTLDDQAQR
jgi:hypothetical protein